MSAIVVAGAGAFGTAVAVSLAAEGRAVQLWARDRAQVAEMRASGRNPRLPAASLPPALVPVADLAPAPQAIVLIAVPAQALRSFLGANAAALAGRRLVACCKGIELATGLRPTEVIAEVLPDAPRAVLTGPGFAADIAAGLPTALTLAAADAGLSHHLQAQLSTRSLRLYRTSDVTGAELGGAMKNVVAIACGIVIGAGLGVSARAALMTRGYAEIVRLATALGARPETLAGLSGLGDLALTCTSPESRNFAFGHALGAGRGFDAAQTVEGKATARAVAALAARHGIAMPVSDMVSALLEGRLDVPGAVRELMARPLKEED
jgi:glycerol-3-phosphate dehydrogenase (NAD(P)+)